MLSVVSYSILGVVSTLKLGGFFFFLWKKFEPPSMLYSMWKTIANRVGWSVGSVIFCIWGC